jgi:hypothetical protein
MADARFDITMGRPWPELLELIALHAPVGADFLITVMAPGELGLIPGPEVARTLADHHPLRVTLHALLDQADAEAAHGDSFPANDLRQSEGAA